MGLFEDDSWRPLSWHCSNCGTLVTAYQNSKGEFKVACPNCRAVMVRIQKGRRRDTIELYAPKGQEHIASD